jgi:hypothetical protein
VNTPERVEQANKIIEDLMDTLDKLNEMGGNFSVEATSFPYGEVKDAVVATIQVLHLTTREHALEVYHIMCNNDMGPRRAFLYWTQLARGVCGACGEMLDPEDGEHHCDLAPAGETAVVSRVLIPTLAEVGELMSTAFRLTTGRTPRWIEADETSIHCDFGVMSTRQFIDHLNG